MSKMSSINAQIIKGDSLEELKKIATNSIDAVITDPPAGISFMGKSWDDDKGGRDHWIAWMQEIMTECNRVLKPGGHSLVWALPRTSHWTARAIEDAGFEIRDVLNHIFASGFPKSLNVHKQLLKQNHPEAEKYKGLGTALKPSYEHWILARKPLEEKTIVENVLKYGTGAIDIDGCRIPTQENLNGGMYSGEGKAKTIADHQWGFQKRDGQYQQPTGRFPANIICSDDALNDGVMTKSGKMGPEHTRHTDGSPNGIYGKFDVNHPLGKTPADSGSKSRYFDIDVWAEKYGLLQFPKASKRERNEGCEGLELKEIYPQNNSIERKELNSTADKRTQNNHPTVKPVHLMSWLIRLVSKEGDTVLDPFMGSGTTGVACKKLGREFIGIELSEEYIKIAEARIK